MQPILKTVCLLALFTLSNQLSAGQPSFDCTKASNNIERSICHSDRLSAQDLKLSRLYKNVLHKVSDDIKKTIKTEQRNWLKTRNRDCQQNASEIENCLFKHYQERNSALSKKLAFDSSDTPEDLELKLLRITPQGNDVAASQQVVFQFDRPVVPIGRMERDANDIPVTITPPLACEWRWLNTSALACQLRSEDKMKAATHYQLVMQPGLKTEQGAQLAKAITHSFTTARPRVTYSRFVNWLSPGTPLIQLTFNQPVTRASVQSSLSMRSNTNPAIPLIAYADNLPRQLPWWMAITNESAQPGIDDRLGLKNGDEARKVWVVEPTQELPLDQNILLEVKPGLVSIEGSQTGVEKRTVVSFDSFPDFKFIGIRCTEKGSRSMSNFSLEDLSKSALDDSATSRCAPLKPVALLFSSPVKNSAFKQYVKFNPPLDGGRKDYDPWENSHDWSYLSSPHRKNRDYQVWLPELLQAYQKYQVDIDIEQLTDEFGRKLANKVDFNFFTAHRNPALRLNHRVAVLEKNETTDVPLYVTNLDHISINYDKLGTAQTANGLKQDIQIEQAEDIAYAKPMGVRQLLGEQSGAVHASLHPSPLPSTHYRAPEILAQVTPFQVHFKIGHFNSLAWVTRFDSDKPVENARVSLWTGYDNQISALKNTRVHSTTDQQGLATLPGLAELDPDLEYIHGGQSYSRHEGFFVRVEAEGDTALVPLNWNFAVSAQGVYPRLQKKGGHTHSWGTTAQGIYKLGDTVQFKIYLREQSNLHWVAAQQERYVLKVYDPQHKVVYEQKDIELNPFGAFDGEFKVAEQGAVGWYQFKLIPAKSSTDKQRNFDWQPMSVLVSDFTPAPFKVKSELNGTLFKAKDQVEVFSQASLHSGGPFNQAEIRLSARLSEKPFNTNNPVAKGFTFGSSSGQQLTTTQQNLLDIRGKLDDKGQYQNAFTLPETGIYFGSLQVESAVKDERGKFVAASSTAEYAGRDRFVGLRTTRWLYEKDKPATLETLVVDAVGALQSGVEVSIAINHREYRASRVKGPGNAYLTKNIMQWVQQSDCKVQSALHAAACEFTPQKPGYYQFVATIKDQQGREHKTEINGWATGSGRVLWDQSNDATLQIIAEQTEYKIGDNARYLVKNPFPGAKALVSVERYGIIDSWVQTLEGSTPVIELPIKADYLPGFYLSVVVVSPRVEKAPQEQKLDLGKPSYRMGYVAAKVVDPYKQLKIQIATDKPVYKPGAQVSASIQVDRKNLQPQDEVEIAVAVVDESVLALNSSGKDYYDPYTGFNRLDALDVNNYSLVSRLLGRQKFEKKGANPGGGGSSYTRLRNQFKFISYWNPSIKPDKNGFAKVDFKLPDNLTGWRIFAFAVNRDDRMGMGDLNLKVNQPTEIRPVMPNQITEGDQFKAGFNVMNRSDRSRDIQLKVSLDGPLAASSARSFVKQITLAPFKRENIWLPLSTQGHGQLKFIATAGDKFDSDSVAHSVPVNPRRSLETASDYGTIVSDHVSQSLKIPQGIYTDVGAISVALSPSVIGNLDGALDYLKTYPHLCWEQRLTKAVGANSYTRLKDYLKKSTQWADPEGDIQKTLSSAVNFQAPNGGMTYWSASNANVSPYLSAYTAIAFNWLRNSGHSIPQKVEEDLHSYLLNLLRRDEFPSFYSRGMSSSVRAVALAALSESGKINSSDIERHHSHLLEMDLFGQSHLLQAAVKTAGVDKDTIKTTVDSILGHASQSGGKFQFNELWEDSYKYLLATPLRSNCAILSSLLSAQTLSDQGNSIGDIPFKLVRSLTQSRGNRDHWENIQENVFCLNALNDYARLYESDDPKLEVSLLLDEQKLGAATFQSRSDPAVTLSRPIQPGDAGRSARIDINKQGEGRLYYATHLAYDLTEDNAARINSGIEIRREYSVERDGEFHLLTSPMQIHRGDLVRIDLFISTPTARHFVAVTDPLPGGLEAVNSNLATASTIDAKKGEFKTSEESWYYKFSNWTTFGRYFWSFYHKELRYDSARFYADYLPAGNYHLSYTAQAIAEGSFSVQPVHGEEMYDPDVYGKGLPATLNVSE